jgi:hypothetical protein
MSSDQEKVASALKVEKLKQNKAVEALDQECQSTVSFIIEVGIPVKLNADSGGKPNGIPG